MNNPTTLNPLGGTMRIIESEHLVDQFRFPRTKKRRIRNKWSRRAANFRPSKNALVDQGRGIIYAHPVMAARLRSSIV